MLTRRVGPGDWGCHISRTLAHLYPRHCRAQHLNADNADPPSALRSPLLALRHAVTPYTARERAGMARTRWFRTEGRGYDIAQMTKPQTLGYGLADSPAALLAWIYEKLRDWTDHEHYSWAPDDVCTWVSLYWFSTAGPAANVRIYYEAVHGPVDDLARARRWSPGVRIGFSRFPRDLQVLPESWARSLGPTVFYRTHEIGGHFASIERPDEIVADVRDMFGKGGGAFGVVKGRSGYS